MLTILTTLRACAASRWSFTAYRTCTSAVNPSTSQVREILHLQLDKGIAAQACVTFTRITRDGGTQAAQAAWQALLPVLQHQRPTFVMLQSSASHQSTCAAVRLVDAQLKALSGSSKQVPPVVGYTVKPWLPEGQHAATGRLIDNQWKGQRHIRLTAAILEDTESASFHTVTDSFPKIPNLERTRLFKVKSAACTSPPARHALVASTGCSSGAALTTRPPHVLLLAHPTFTDTQLANLIVRLESGFQNAEILGLVPTTPLPDQDLDIAKEQLEVFRSEAGAILGEANAAGDLAAPLAVAAAEAEALTLAQLEGEAEDASSEDRQEEEAIFVGDTSFMQGAVGLTLMPPNLASRASTKDLAALACFVIGTDKSYGLFMSAELRHLIYSARNQQSRIAPPPDDAEADIPLLTAADLHEALQAAGATSENGDNKTAVSNLQNAREREEGMLEHLQGGTKSQLRDAAPVSSLGSATADSLSSSQDWVPARVALPGMMLVPSCSIQEDTAPSEQDSSASGQVAAPVQQEPAVSSLVPIQTDTQLPIFAIDSVLWPNQLMILRVFEPRYKRLIKSCQANQGCFGLASGGVGTTAMLDRVQAEDDSSYSVTIQGGRRFLVQKGSAQVLPGSFGLTMVEPQYIHDKDQDSPQVAALALAAAKELSIAHLGAGIDEAYSASMSEYRSTKLDRAVEEPEDAASRWREGVLEDAGASSAFAGAFDTTRMDQAAAKTRPVRTDWTPAAAQELSFLLSSALPVPPTMRRKWLRMTSLSQRLRQQLDLLQESRPRNILGNILNALPEDSRFHELLYPGVVVST